MNPESAFLSSCTSGGCGAKIGAGELAQLLGALPRAASPSLLVGFDASDDAAVYDIGGGRALISTADFFSPMVDDPRSFGRIAAANALSDVYAMGGTPLLALNLVCFPEHLPREMLGEMLEGGAQKIAEAGAALGGGHSIYDREPKYGLAVTGMVETRAILRNNTPRAGDRLILTKPLGVGILLAAARGDAASPAALRGAIECMERLNRYAAQHMAGYAVSACTDVTGFGLMGHLLEMCGDAHTAWIDVDGLPALPEAVAYAGEYLLTAAGQRNRNHFMRAVPGADDELQRVPFALQELIFDPQTSGGLLISVAAADADALLTKIRETDPWACFIGEIRPREARAIRLHWEGSDHG